MAALFELEAAEQTGLLSDGREVSLSAGTRSNSAFPPLTPQSSAANKAKKDKLYRELQAVQELEARVAERLVDATELTRRINKELTVHREERRHLERRIKAVDHQAHLMAPKAGRFDFVDSSWFGVVSNCIVLCNMASILLADRIPPYATPWVNNLLLVWYVFELTLKFAHHGKDLFFGPWMASMWNWLDLGIVFSGIVDQWLLPIFLGQSTHGGCFAMLRLLRLFRFLRFLKLVKTFLVADLDWIHESENFDRLMAGVIVLNGIVISFQLDYPWDGWVWVDNSFLVTYTSELLLRFKRWGLYFFTHPTDWTWNWFDFSIVTAGIGDLWLMPAITLFRQQVYDENVDGFGQDTTTRSLLSMVKLMRLMRVLRLVRVLRSVPPLYTLLVGVYGAFQAMKWVIVLTLLTLYGGAIVFTNLVGKGLIYEHQEAPPEALKVFGTMSASLFSLFEMMNGDTEVIKPIKTQIVGKILFALFMIIANWAILAILTAVVSENMITVAGRFAEAENEKQAEVKLQKSEDRLMEIFEREDVGLKIGKAKWLKMIEDGPTREELSEGTHLTKDDMVDLFACLEIDDSDVGGRHDGRVDVRDLIHSLKENTTLADKRSVLHVMIRLRAMQDQLTARHDENHNHTNARFDALEKFVLKQQSS